MAFLFSFFVLKWETGAAVHFAATFLGGFFIQKEMIFTVSDMLENDELIEQQQFKLVSQFP